MIGFIIRRLIAAVFLLIIVSMATFAIFFLLPKLGGQTNYGLATQYVGRNPTRAAVLQMEAQLGLNRPVYLQYWHYLSAIFVGEHFGTGTGSAYCPPPCFGYSFKNQQPVWPMMVSDIPVTVSLAIGAAVLWLVFGITVGVISALKRGTIFGMDLGALLGGAILTEYTFSLHGLGLFTIEAIQNQDFPEIMGVVLLAAFFIVIANLCVDILYAVVDPRVRY